MKSYFHGQLAKGIEIIGIEISDDAYDQLKLYFSELRKWNSKVNLVTRRVTDLQLIENHFLDSLMLLPLLKGENVHLMDVGSGAGFPGLVCKVAQPGLSVTLIEPRLKRVSFLKHIIRTLGLDDVRVLACRIEDGDALSDSAEFTHITCRAVSELSLFLTMVKRFSSSKATIICMKGPRWPEEIKKTLHLPFVLKKVDEYVLPFSEAQRSLLMFDYT